jgi:transposase
VLGNVGYLLRSLISARKKLVGQRVTLENQIRGLAVVFGIRLPRALTAAFIDNALKASEGIAGLSAAMRGRDRQAVNDAQGEGRAGASSRDYHARDAAGRNRVRIGISPRNPRDRRPKPAPKRSDA